MQLVAVLIAILSLNTACKGFIHPITIKEKGFIDSITNEPFYIKGVDYQPGGSSEVNKERDPLSNFTVCARDIFLFQKLGINTIRIYSINPDLNHDACMSLLAAAGIYLLLDVNSPLPNQHLNRYEPWTTYNDVYLNHVFKVVEQFSSYNNTLGFFAGNEIVNDKKSASNSPPYIKSLVQDMKKYSQKHQQRNVPVGYSAADDLNYRISLANYLECTASSSSTDSTVDFYGINSYQWCGQQNMETSGYNKLVEAYVNYTKPVIFSEFGCNLILPREFGEVQSLFSPDMFNTFSGGLVYEFSQESNNYGLVKIENNGDVKLLNDFEELRKKYSNANLPSAKDISKSLSDEYGIKTKKANNKNSPLCKAKYSNLNVDGSVSKGFVSKIIEDGVIAEKGKYIILKKEDLNIKFNISNPEGKPFEKRSLSITPVGNTEFLFAGEEMDNANEKNTSSSNAVSLVTFFFTLLVYFGL